MWLALLSSESATARGSTANDGSLMCPPERGLAGRVGVVGTADVAPELDLAELPGLAVEVAAHALGIVGHEHHRQRPFDRMCAAQDAGPLSHCTFGSGPVSDAAPTRSS